LGWVVAPQKVISKLVFAKQAVDLHTGTFVQYVAHILADRKILKNHVKHLRTVYGERRDIMLNAMKEQFPEEAQWTTPEGGLFLWVKTPEGVKSKDLLDAAVEEKVAFVPGYAFYTDSDGGQNGMRLNFSNSKPDQIREGIERLGRAMRRMRG
jgi:2-aminoadipate transaminase